MALLVLIGDLYQLNLDVIPRVQGGSFDLNLLPEGGAY